MFEAIMMVVDQVAIMFLMLAIGFACAKKGLITRRGTAQITSVLIYVVSPAVIVSALQSSGDTISVENLLWAGGMAILSVGLFILCSFLFFRKQEERRRKVLRFGLVYSNCGLMGLPLVQGVFGDEAVGYAAAFLAVFTVFLWTHGYIMMSGSHGSIVKKLVFNPGIIGFVVALVLFLFSLKLPTVLGTLVDSLSACNTPLAMIVVGSYVARLTFREMFSDRYVYIATALRLVLFPLILLAVSWWLHPDPLVFVTTLVLAASPVGANTVLFAVQFGSDAKLGVKLVAFSTLVSIVTMPLYTALAEWSVGML